MGNLICVRNIILAKWLHSKKFIFAPILSSGDKNGMRMGAFATLPPRPLPGSFGLKRFIRPKRVRKPFSDFPLFRPFASHRFSKNHLRFNAANDSLFVQHVLWFKSISVFWFRSTLQLFVWAVIHCERGDWSDPLQFQAIWRRDKGNERRTNSARQSSTAVNINCARSLTLSKNYILMKYVGIYMNKIRIVCLSPRPVCVRRVDGVRRFRPSVIEERAGTAV